MAKNDFMQSPGGLIESNATLFAKVSHVENLWTRESAARDKMTEFFAVIVNWMDYAAFCTGVPIAEVQPAGASVGYMEFILWRICRAWCHRSVADFSDEPGQPLDLVSCLFMWAVFEWLGGQKKDVWPRFEDLIQRHPFCCVGHGAPWASHCKPILTRALEKEDLVLPRDIPRLTSPHIFVIRQAWHLRNDVSREALRRLADVTDHVEWPAWVGVSKTKVPDETQRRT